MPGLVSEYFTEQMLNYFVALNVTEYHKALSCSYFIVLKHNTGLLCTTNVANMTIYSIYLINHMQANIKCK